MPRARTLFLGLSGFAFVLAGVVAGCDSASDAGSSGDGGADGTLDGPLGTDGAGSDGAIGSDGATLGDGASGSDADGTHDGAVDATSDASADASVDALGIDVVVDSAGFLDSAPDDAGACNTLVNGATQVQQIDIATARPAATGGSIVDGLYFKTSDTVYTGVGGGTGPTGYFVRETLTITNASTGTALLTSTFLVNGVDNTTERITMSPTTSTGATTLIFVCPAYGPSPTFYNVRTGDAGQLELDIYISTDRIETFTRQ